MSTEAQIIANTANAQFSTGPITPDGKARSAANAIKYGFYAKQAVLLSEEDLRGRGHFVSGSFSKCEGRLIPCGRAALLAILVWHGFGWSQASESGKWLKRLGDIILDRWGRGKFERSINGIGRGCALGQINLDSITSPSGHAAPEEIGVFCPNRAV